jgi:hypothetical protein
VTDLREAAEMALEALESLDCGDTYKTHNAASALRQALAAEKPPVKTYAGGKPNYCTPEVAPEVTTEVPCKTHPDAPHGFDRNASHSADRYVCECESWEPVVVDDIVYRLRKRAEIRRQIPDRKSVQEGKPDRVADLLEEAADYIEKRDNSSWVGLTAPEVNECYDLNPARFASRIEAKLKEKNSA